MIPVFSNFAMSKLACDPNIVGLLWLEPPGLSNRMQPDDKKPRSANHGVSQKTKYLSSK